MALDVEDFKEKLKESFKRMKEVGTDDYFASELSKAVADYGATAEITTADAGQVSTGTFAGNGSGTLSLDYEVCYAPLLVACNAMKAMAVGGNQFLATSIGTCIDLMTKAGVVETDVIGITTSPSGSPVPPTNGEAKGTIACVSVALVAGLNACFLAMDSLTEGGDDYFAEQFATLVDAYLKASVVTTSGVGVLAGTTGTGTLS